MSDEPEDHTPPRDPPKPTRSEHLVLGGAKPLEVPRPSSDFLGQIQHLARVAEDTHQRRQAAEAAAERALERARRLPGNMDLHTEQARRMGELHRAHLATSEHLAELLKVTLAGADEEARRRKDERDQWDLAAKRWRTEKRLLVTAVILSALSVVATVLFSVLG